VDFNQVFEEFKILPDEICPPASVLEALALMNFAFSSLFQFEKHRDKKRARDSALRLACWVIAYLMYFAKKDRQDDFLSEDVRYEPFTRGV